MTRLSQRMSSMLIGDAQAERLVPPSGFTARLTVFSAAAMAFLAVFALALALASARLADRWGSELARSSTIRISAPADQLPAQTAAVLRLLETTSGVASARALDEAEQRALLAPWFGPDLPVESLPIPQLIEVIEQESGFDPAGVRLRLEAEVPGAILDDHTRWRRPLIEAAGRLRTLGWISILLIATTMAAIVTLAAQAALAANAQVIAVLRLVGAQDFYIANAFVRRFSLRAAMGASAGTIAAAILVSLIPSVHDASALLAGLGFQGLNWLLLPLIPVAAGLVAYGATRLAARRTLRELP